MLANLVANIIIINGAAHLEGRIKLNQRFGKYQAFEKAVFNFLPDPLVADVDEAADVFFVGGGDIAVDVENVHRHRCVRSGDGLMK